MSCLGSSKLPVSGVEQTSCQLADLNMRYGAHLSIRALLLSRNQGDQHDRLIVCSVTDYAILGSSKCPPIRIPRLPPGGSERYWLSFVFLLLFLDTGCVHLISLMWLEDVIASSSTLTSSQTRQTVFREHRT